MENPQRYTNYNDFFPFYLREHSKKSNALFWNNWLSSIVLVTFANSKLLVFTTNLTRGLWASVDWTFLYREK